MTWRACVLLVAALTGCSSSSDPASGAGEADDVLIALAIQRADRNGDGVVAADEWAIEGAALFERLDRNRDQAIDAVEWQESFEILDLDGDGAIEREEAAALVARGDRDGDGQLSRAEFALLDWERLSGDLNRDARISRAEFYVARDQLFLAADRNGDGRLAPREIEPVRFALFRF